MIADLFTNPIKLGSGVTLLAGIVPLCAAIAIVYRTVRTKDVRRLPVQIAGLIAYMIVGLVAGGCVLWAIHRYWP